MESGDHTPAPNRLLAMGQQFGKASVQYNDLRGTVSIDGPDDDERLYELAGLSKDEWFIAAYEIYGSYGSTSARVWAIPQNQANYDRWEEIARQGKKTVAAQRFDFQVEDEDAALALLKLNKRWNIHVLWKALADLELDLETED
jgi:hypothetical protein